MFCFIFAIQIILMENPQIDYKKQSTLHGLILGLYSAVLLWLTHKFNFEDNLLISLISITVAVLLVFFPIHQYKINNDNLLKLGTALKIGLIVGLVGGLIYAIYTYYHYISVDSEFIPKTIEESRQALELQKNDMPDEQYEQAKAMTETMVSPFFFATFGLFTILFKSFIIALVIGLIKKK